jgi:Mg-chelatase subunit ChlD
MRQSSRVSLVVLADVSGSVDARARADTRSQIARLRAAIGRGHAHDDSDLKVVEFARDPREVAAAAAAKPSSLPATAADSGKDPRSTDLQRALKLAYSLFEPEHVPNVLLISDGNETRGDLASEAEHTARLGIRVDYLAPRPPSPAGVSVRRLSFPPDLALGVPFTLRAELTAEQPSRVRLELFTETQPPKLEATRELELAAGVSELSFPLVVKTAGRVEYELVLQPSAPDRWPDNNAASVAADIPGPPRILILDSQPPMAASLAQALRGRDFEVEVRPPAAAARRDADLDPYAFVILSDVSARELRPDALSTLRRYVEEFGGGLLVTGGTQGFGLGGYQGGTFEQLLPVRAAAEEQRDQASLALALIIDCSGSMAGGKLELAREAAALTAQTLADPDLIEVIGFSSQPERRVRLQPASNRASIAQSIARLAATGGTQLYPALDAAYRDLRGAQARLKHAILLTDGQTQEAGIEDLASSMRADGITLSTVGLGSEVNRGLLETIAALGGGRAYFPLEAQNVPQIFMSEASRHKRPSAVDHSTRMFEREHAGFLEGIPLAAAPPLGGYVTSQAKPRPAQVLLETERGEPLLARWRVGLGYALAWTSDLKARWSNAFLRWPSFARFVAQLVREHMRAPDARQVAVEARVERDHVRLIADAVGGGDHFEDGLDASVKIVGRLGEVASVPLIQTAPARYETVLPWTQSGAFTLEARFRRGDRTYASGRGQFVRFSAEEFGFSSPNSELLARVAARTGGRQLPTAVEAFEAGSRRVPVREVWWPTVAWLALGFFLLEQCVRHARLLGRTSPPVRKRG